MAAKGGKKGRKIGRSQRHPAAKRYTGEKRWEVNARKRVARHLKRMVKKALHRQAWLDRKAI